jgi:tetratricopeptide (TPR) repeat protein
MTGRQDLFDESMRLGHSAAWDMQWARAIEFYRKALAEFPDHPTALTSLALALLETGELKESLATYRRAAQVSPEDAIPIEKMADLHERLGQLKDALELREKASDLYIRQRDVEKALDNWNHIARLQPENLATRSRLALTYERLGRPKEAVREYLAVASVLQKLGRNERAIESAQRALTLIPGEPEATAALRVLREGKPLPPPIQPRGATAPLRMAQVKEFIQAGEPAPGAESDEERSDAVDPEVAAQRHALTLLAGMLFDEPQDAVTGKLGTPGMNALTKGEKGEDGKVSGRPQAYRYLGQAIDLQTHGHTQQAAKDLARAIDSGLDHPAAHYDLGLLYRELGDEEGARKHLTAALGHPELSLGANLALGRMARTKGDLPEASRFLLQALRKADSLSVEESQSSQLSQLYDTIQASQNVGDTQALSQIVENTLTFLSGPEWLKRLRQARQQLTGQRHGSGVVPIAEMLAVGGTDRVMQAMARIDELVNMGFLASASEEAMLALQSAPTYLALHQRMADIMLKDGRTEQAIEKLRVIAETYIIRGDGAQSIEIFQTILTHSPVDIPIRLRLIDLLSQQDRLDEALHEYLELSELYKQMAEIDEARKTLAEALRLAQRSTVDRHRSVEILHQMGDLDLSRLDWRRALRVYEQVRTIDPADDKARHNVIDLNLRLGQEDQAAKELDSYLELLVQAGRNQDALDMLEEMAREHPGKQTLHTRLADAYRAAGRKADAIAQYDALGEIQLDAGQAEAAARTIQTILSLDPPDSEGYRELLRNLEAGQ